MAYCYFSLGFDKDAVYSLGEDTFLSLGIEAGRHLYPGLRLLLEAYNKDMEEGSFCSLPACSCLASKSIPSLALEPTSLGF